MAGAALDLSPRTPRTPETGALPLLVEVDVDVDDEGSRVDGTDLPPPRTERVRVVVPMPTFSYQLRYSMYSITSE